MKTILIATLVTFVAACGCQKMNQQLPVVDISLLNKSTNTLNDVDLKWNGPFVPGGILIPGAAKTSAGVDWPNVSSGKLDFVDEQTRKPYSIELSFSEMNKMVSSGKCHDIVIEILSYDKAQVVCGGK